MEYTKLNVQDEDGNGRNALSVTNNVPTLGGTTIDWSKWKLKIIVMVALTLRTSSQSILIVWSKRNTIIVLPLQILWLSTTLDEVIVYPIPALLYLVKNLLQYYILEHVDAPGYQIQKNLNVTSTGVLYRFILKKDLDVFQTPVQGWVMAIVMALLSGLAGVYTEAIIKKRPSRNISVQNFFLYVFGMLFSTVAIVTQDFDAVMNKGFFYGYSFIKVLMILNQTLSGLAVFMVMKYVDNIVKVYSTSVAMLFTTFVSYYLFAFDISYALIFGTVYVNSGYMVHLPPMYSLIIS